MTFQVFEQDNFVKIQNAFDEDLLIKCSNKYLPKGCEVGIKNVDNLVGGFCNFSKVTQRVLKSLDFCFVCIKTNEVKNMLIF